MVAEASFEGAQVKQSERRSLKCCAKHPMNRDKSGITEMAKIQLTIAESLKRFRSRWLLLSWFDGEEGNQSEGQTCGDFM